MSMLLFVTHRLWSIFGDSGSVVSSVVSSDPALLSFHMLTGNLDRAPSYDTWTDRCGENAAPRTQCVPFSGASEKNHSADQPPLCLPHDRAVGGRNRRSTRHYPTHVGWHYQCDTSPCLGRARARRGDQQSTDLLSLYTPMSYVNAPYHCHRADADLSVVHPSHWGQNRDPFPCFWLAGLSRLLSGLAGIHSSHYRRRP